jgi:PAS domain S-box-containing protein
LNEAVVDSDFAWVSDALKSGGTGLWRWDVKADQVIWTDNIRRLMGADADVPQGREGFLQMIRPEDRAAFQNAIDLALKTDTDFRYEFQVTKGDSGTTWLEAFGHVLKDENGVPFAIDGAIFDVTRRISTERQLIETHDWYQKIISATGLVVYRHDILHDEYQTANLAVLEEMMGQRYEGSHSKFWSGVKALETTPTGELAGLPLSQVKELYRTGKVNVWRSEYKILRSDGQIRWLYDHAFPIRDSAGNIVGSFGTLQDLTELRRLSEAIEMIVSRTSGTGEAYLRQLVMALSEVLEVKAAMIGELEPGKFDSVKTVAVAIDGKTVENFAYSLEGTPCEGVTDSGLCFHRENVQELFPEDTMLAAMGANAYLGAPIRSVGGENLGLIAVLHDKRIDETLNPANILQLFAAHAAGEIQRQRSEQKLKESESLYRSLVGVQSEGIVVLNQKGQVLASNASAQRMLRMTEAEVAGTSAWNPPLRVINKDGTPCPPEENPAILALKTGQAKTDSIRGFMFDDGSVMWVSTNAMPIENSDGAGNRHVVVSFADVTARIKAEEELKQLNSSLEALVDDRTFDLRRANRELESFAYSVSHDLRQPLRSIDGFTRILEMDYGAVLDGTAKQHIDTIRAATRRMSHLIDDLLRLSRLISHEVRVQSIDLTKMSNEILASLHPEKSGRQYEFVVEDDLKIRGDENLLRAALDNLIQNAWKFSANREKTIIRVGKKGDAFFVNDNGVGFDMQYSSKLFEPFQRLHTQKEFEGTGIGLATVRRIIERHKGEVWAESELGKGTTMYFRVATK